jgi:hypothetical protein
MFQQTRQRVSRHSTLSCRVAVWRERAREAGGGGGQCAVRGGCSTARARGEWAGARSMGGRSRETAQSVGDGQTGGRGSNQFPTSLPPSLPAAPRQLPINSRSAGRYPVVKDALPGKYSGRCPIVQASCASLAVASFTRQWQCAASVPLRHLSGTTGTSCSFWHPLVAAPS